MFSGTIYILHILISERSGTLSDSDKSEPCWDRDSQLKQTNDVWPLIQQQLTLVTKIFIRVKTICNRHN